METTTRSVTNTVTKVNEFFKTDEDFLTYAKRVYKENEDDNPFPSELHWLPDNIYNAVEYIHEYCPDLKLIEF